MSDKSITRTLAEFAANLSYDLPAEVATRAKQLLLDITGITVRARTTWTPRKPC